MDVTGTPWHRLSHRTSAGYGQDMIEHYEGLQLTIDGARADLLLDRPDRRNALSTQTLLALATAARLIDDHEDVRVVVVRGLGPSFCGGMHLDAFGPDGDGSIDAARAGREMGDAIEGMQAVAVAAIHGHCVGGGLVLAAACDLRVAADDAQFSIPEVDLGIPLAWGGLHRLVREIGPARAKEFVMTCRPFDATEALGAGFLNRVVAVDQLDTTVDELARLVASKPAFPVQTTKATANAITRSMVSLETATRDDDHLARSLRDEESRAAAADYLSRFGRR